MTFAVISTAVVLSSEATAVASPSTSTLVVHVTYADGVAAKALVDTPAPPVYSTGMTDSLGRVELRGLPADSHQQVCGSDAGPREDKPDWTGSSRTCVDVVTPPAGARASVDLQLHDAAGLTGSVRFGNGQPAVGALLYAHSTDGGTSGSVYTSTDGAVSLTRLAAGNYTLCVRSSDDSGAGCVGGGLTEASAHPVYLPAGVFTPVNLTLTPTMDVTGQVSSAGDQTPVDGAAVVIRTAAGAVIAKPSSGNNPHGTYFTGLLPFRPGPLSVCVTPPIATVSNGTPAPTGQAGRCVTFTAVKGYNRYDIALDAGGAVDGATTDQAGHTVGGVTVEMWQTTDAGTRRVRTATSDMAGRWSIGALSAGSYTVCFRAPTIKTSEAPRGFTPRCWADNPYDPTAADRISVTSGQRTGPVVGRLIAK